jgi:hypothetical protein
MKVIKPGRAQKKWAKEFKCTGTGNGSGGCGATLLVEEDDLFQTHVNSMDETDYFTTFKCCACGVFTDIPTPDHLNTLELPTQVVWDRKHRASATRTKK